VKIGFLYGQKYYLRNIVTALETLAERGHDLVVALPDGKRGSVLLPRTLEGNPRVTTALYPNRRDDGLERSVALLRAVRNAVRYELPPLRDAYANRRRAYRKLLSAFSAPSADALPSLELSNGDLSTLAAGLADLEELVPPGAPLVQFIREQNLDAVVCLGRVNFNGGESDIAKAARAAGVPCGLIVYSWDNLSSKALVHVHPDRVFVWNDWQVDEAVELHGIPCDRVIATGAARFDPFFMLAASAPRAELLDRFGLDRRARTVLYLGSSGFVTKREPEFIERWIGSVRAGDRPELRNANILVRPHPGTLDEPAWVGWSPSGPGVAMPTPHRRPQDLYDQLFVADAVVALNTSAELEAAIVDRPVLTIEIGDLAPGQEGSSHFQYLLVGQGGFVDAARSLDEHIDELGRAITDDPRAEQRRRFIERFVRPRGLDQPVGAVLADEIEALAGIAETAL
jgi:hypothetical protein